MGLPDDRACPSASSAFLPQLPQLGFVRLPQVLAPRGPIPVSKSTWWAGVKSGRFPAPVKIGGVTAWRVDDIHALISIAHNEAPHSVAKMEAR
jgi:predicted DNA-binding transcriptional regulator AlpA